MDKAREEFLAETQEIIENLSRNLLALDAAFKGGNVDPSLINEAFRAVHTLKGLSGLFGAEVLGALSRRLEDLLDELRLGKRRLGVEVLDVLFSSVEAFGRALETEKQGGGAPLSELEHLFRGLKPLSEPGPDAHAGVAYELDPGVLAVLTEFEEHRLRANAELGKSLYRLRVRFDLATIDRELESIKERAKHHGEILTYLPSGEAGGGDAIDIDLLLASGDDLATLVDFLGGSTVTIQEIPRRGGAPQSPAAISERSLSPSAAAPQAPEGTASAVERATGAAAAAAAATAEDRSLRSLRQTVRVDIRRLDYLMNVVGELGIVRAALGRFTERLRRGGERQLAAELQRLHRTFDRRLSELQGGLLEARMVLLGQVFERLARIVRQISRELGKEIRLVITGAETEIDKLIVEELSDPLMHIIRNAIDHGIESAERRAAVGKPSAGTIALNAYQKGNHVMIEVEDDGRGIDETALVARAVELGKLEPDDVASLSRQEALALVFIAGVSTRTEVGDVSGRGVGMDVVKTNIAKLGGIVDIHSSPGVGTKLTITLPITLAIVSALLVRVEEHTFALPLASISEALALDESAVRMVDRREAITLRGSTLPLCRLSRLFGLPTREKRAGQRGFVVVAMLGGRRLGLVVDHLFGQQDIVIKPLGSLLVEVKGFTGATELGDQRVGLVLDAAAILDEALSGGEVPRLLGAAHG